MNNENLIGALITGFFCKIWPPIGIGAISEIDLQPILQFNNENEGWLINLANNEVNICQVTIPHKTFRGENLLEDVNRFKRMTKDIHVAYRYYEFTDNRFKDFIGRELRRIVLNKLPNESVTSIDIHTDRDVLHCFSGADGTQFTTNHFGNRFFEDFNSFLGDTIEENLKTLQNF